MLKIAISGYIDYLERMTTEQIREEVQAIDHDCSQSPDDGCATCGMIAEANREALINIIFQHTKGEYGA